MNNTMVGEKNTDFIRSVGQKTTGLGGTDFDFDDSKMANGDNTIDALEQLHHIATLLPHAKSATIQLFSLETKPAMRVRIKVIYSKNENEET